MFLEESADQIFLIAESLGLDATRIQEKSRCLEPTGRHDEHPRSNDTSSATQILILNRIDRRALGIRTNHEHRRVQQDLDLLECDQVVTTPQRKALELLVELEEIRAEQVRVELNDARPPSRPRSYRRRVSGDSHRAGSQ